VNVAGTALAKFVGVTMTTKKYVLVTREKNILMIRTWTELKNVPYSDSFNNEELYTIVGLPLQPTNPGSPVRSPNLEKPSHRIAYRVSSRVVFRKSIAFFGSKIENGSFEKGVESFKNWTEWAEVKIAEHRTLIPVPIAILPKDVKIPA
jgi:hypothetical protein